MTQYDEEVKRQKLRVEATEWAKGVKCLHAHSFDSMAYDDRPQDTAKGTKSVIDLEFNSGIIERWQDEKLIHTFGKKLTDDELIDMFTRK